MPRNLELVVVFLSTRSTALSVIKTLIISFKIVFTHQTKKIRSQLCLDSSRIELLCRYRAPDIAFSLRLLNQLARTEEKANEVAPILVSRFYM
jgi:hypothetical protein